MIKTQQIYISDCNLLKHIITSSIEAKKTNNKFLEYIARENYRKCNPSLLKMLYLSIPLLYDDKTKNIFLYNSNYFKTVGLDIFLKDMDKLQSTLNHISTTVAVQTTNTIKNKVAMYKVINNIRLELNYTIIKNEEQTIEYR